MLTEDKMNEKFKPRFFTHPEFQRPSLELLGKNAEDEISILSNPSTVFILFHRRQVAVQSIITTEKRSQLKDRINDNRNSEALLSKESKRIASSTLNNDLPESQMFEGMLTETRDGSVGSLIQGFRLDGVQLQRLLLILRGRSDSQTDASKIRTKTDSEVVDISACHVAPKYIMLGEQRQTKTLYYVCELSDFDQTLLKSNLPSNVYFAGVKSVVHLVHKSEDAAALSIAHGLCEFHRTSTYCQKCKGLMRMASHGTCRECSNCLDKEFPRQDPAVLAVVTCGPYCLLGRKKEWPDGRMSIIAGFTELGESIEETVVREVKEESNVDVDISSLQYYGSQPWLFPRSLMFGFYIPLSPINEKSDVVRGERNFPETAFLLDSDPYIHLLPIGLRPELPASTQGGFYLKEDGKNLFWLPAAHPADHEMEQIRWVHYKFIKYWSESADEERNINQHLQSKLTSNQFHLPPKFSLSRELIDFWLKKKEKYSDSNL